MKTPVKILLLLLFSCLITAGTFAQRTITGKVVDKSQQPIPGVNVAVVGTTLGAATDLAGKYTITVPSGTRSLTFSYVGMEPQEIVIGDLTVIDVTMSESAIGLDEVLVVGYQTKQKSNLTGSVSTISSKQLENRPVAKLTQLLPGLAPGLTVTRNNPGRIGASDVGIRIGGITSRSSPDILIVIDGVPQENSAALNTINYNDVESISILKDAEAAIYGSRASGGVMVITTKRGKGSNLSASVSTSFATPNIYRRTTNMLEMLELQQNAWISQNETPFFGYPGVFKYIKDNDITFDKIKNNDFKYVLAPGNFPDTPYLVFGHTDWMEEMYGTAATKNYDVSASGSSDKTNYYASLGVVDEGSMLKYGNNSSLTYYLRLKYEYKFNKVIKVGANLSLRNQNWVEPSNYSFIENLISVKHSLDHPYTPEGRYMNWGGYQQPIGWAKEAGDRRSVYYNIQPQLYTEITPTDNLNIRVNVSKSAYFDRSRWLNKQFQMYFWDETPSFPNIQPNQTQVGDIKTINQSFIGNAQATYKYTFNNTHHLRALAGFSHEEFSFDKTTSYRNNLAYTELYTLNMGDSKEQFNSDAQSEYSLRSAFGNLSYSYKDRYNVEGTARYDGSSRFAEGYKWKPFFGAGVSWNVTNEKFIKNLNLKALDNLKIRASWGQLGNQNSIGLYDFVSRVNISQSNLLMGDPSATSLLQIATLSGFPSLTRTWEIAEKMNFGLDIDMFGNRLNGAFNFFITQNKNMFYQEEFPQVLGTSAPSINGAHVKTTGWDASLKWTDKFGEAFFYHAGFGIADAKTKVISLSDSRITRYGYNGFLEGYPVGTVFGYKFDGFIKDAADLAAYNAKFTAGIPKRLRPGDAKYLDLDNDGILESKPYKVDASGNPTDDSGDLVDLGDLERHNEYYFNLGFNWKGLDFEVLLVGVGKWLQFDQTPQNNAYPWIQPLSHIYGDCWTPTNTGAKYPAYSMIISDFNPDINVNNYLLSNAAYMANNVPYLSVKNVRLGYTIPQSFSRRIRIDKLYVYVNVSDAGYLISRVPKSFSPEQPFYSSLTPYPRTISVGLNLNF